MLKVPLPGERDVNFSREISQGSEEEYQHDNDSVWGHSSSFSVWSVNHGKVMATFNTDCERKKECTLHLNGKKRVQKKTHAPGRKFECAHGQLYPPPLTLPNFASWLIHTENTNNFQRRLSWERCSDLHKKPTQKKKKTHTRGAKECSVHALLRQGWRQTDGRTAQWLESRSEFNPVDSLAGQAERQCFCPSQPTIVQTSLCLTPLRVMD